MIKPFSRDTAFFQSLRDRNMTIAHGDLDNSFNEVVEYLNKIINPIIDTLANKQAVGIKDNENAFLRNVGDGTTIFDIVRNSDISDSILPFDRLSKTTPFAILASNNNEDLKPVTFTGDNQSLIGNTSNLPQWSKLTFDNFSDSTIVSANVGIAALSSRHLAQDILGKPLNENSIETRYIKDNTIYAEKIADASIADSKISMDLLNTRVNVSLLKFKNRCISSRTISNDSFNLRSFIETLRCKPIKCRGILTPACIPLNAIKLKRSASYDECGLLLSRQVDNGILPIHIKDRSLDLYHLRPNFPIRNATVIKRKNLSDELLNILKLYGGLYD